MKLIVKKRFRDKYDSCKLYGTGTVLEVTDKERADDLVARGLCGVYGGKKKAATLWGGKNPAKEPAEVTEKDKSRVSAEEKQE